jgi:ABC-type microcin C transport system duplicated ATPase subunit YejF
MQMPLDYEPAPEGSVAAMAERLGREPQDLCHDLMLENDGQTILNRPMTNCMEPSLLVADEPVSSLDVSLQGQVINLLRSLNETLGLTIIIISHDLAIVARVYDQMAVTFQGRIVESGMPDVVFSSPAHPYTRALLDAVPRGLQRRQRTVLPA